MSPRILPSLAVTAVVLLLTGCEIPGVYPDPKVVQRTADAQAIGGACRHALRGIEDCYTLNPKALKAAVFTGWKDMDAYMRENKIDGVASVVKVPVEGEEAATDNTVASSKAAPEAKTAAKGKGKVS